MDNNVSKASKNTVVSRLVAISGIPKKGLRMKVRLEEAEERALCDFYTLLSVESFEAELFLQKKTGSRFHLTGVVKAVVIQPCVVSLAPVTQPIEEEIDLSLVPETEFDRFMEKSDGEGALVLSFNHDVPDTFTGETIDVGALMLEHLALGLDPYPQAEGAQMDKTKIEGEDRPSSFAALAELRAKMKSS